jgi:H+/Cl- antiporter ClcA
VSLGGGATIGVVFGLLAAVCAYVIAYSEYRRNWTFTGSAVRMALGTALVTFVIFFLAGLLLPFLFEQLASGG